MWFTLSLIFAQVNGTESVPFEPGEALKISQRAWREALEDRPQLVTLSASSNQDDSRSQKLEERLRLLEAKAFSNREWKVYWERQASTARAYADELSRAGVPDGAAKAKALRDWANLSNRKIENQDVYLEAVVTERDALENAIDATDQVEDSKRAQENKPLVSTHENPLHRHRRYLDELDRRLKGQNAKRMVAEADDAMVERQIQSTGILVKAQEIDSKLAAKELRIAKEQSKPSLANNIPWSVEYASYWSGRAKEIQQKFTRLKEDLRGQLRQLKAYQIEQTLVEGRIKYRLSRIQSLEQERLDASRFGRWSQVAFNGLIDWSQRKGWQVILGLLLIAVFLKLGLVLIDSLGRGIQRAADDGNDNHQTAAEQRAGTIAAVLTGLLRIGAFVVAGLIALDTIGVNTAPLLGSVAILGLAISFGSQSLVKDLVNGFFILIENQYAVGDVVEIASQTGTVEQINLRSTRIRQLDGTLHVIPNGSISRVANLTRDWCRALCHVGVGYSSDLNQVERVVNEVGQRLFSEDDWQGRLRDAPSFIGVTELADSAVTFRVMATTGPGEQWAVVRELNKRLKEAFDAEGIEIPFPQRVIHNVQS